MADGPRGFDHHSNPPLPNAPKSSIGYTIGQRGVTHVDMKPTANSPAYAWKADTAGVAGLKQKHIRSANHR